MEILQIKTKKPEPVLQSYLGRYCNAWTDDKKNILMTLKDSVRFFKTRSALKSFVTHCANHPVKISLKEVDLKKLPLSSLAQIMFRKAK